jgi:hypothetical protein
VVTNVSSTGAGLRVPDPIPTDETVTVTMVFLDAVGVLAKETRPGTVAWIAPSPKGFLMGVRWRSPADPAPHMV